MNIWKKLDFSYFYALLGESTLALMFLLYVVIARVTGPEQYGVFSAAVALAGILGVLIQFGLPVLLTRSVAANPSDGSRNTLRFLLIQTLNSIPILLVLPLITHAMGFSNEGILLCYLMIAAEWCRSMKMSWRSIMKGHGWFKTESISVFLERLLTVALAATILFTTKNIVLTTVALVIARMLDNAANGIYLGKRFPLSHGHQHETWLQTYRKSLPFALHGLLWVVYYQVDIIMLKALAPAEQVGYYGVAYRVMEIFGALPRVVFYVAFTQFAKCHAENAALMPTHIYKALRMLFILILPCLVIAGFAQPYAMPLLFGQAYMLSVGLLAVLLPGLAIKMFSTLTEEYLLATEREKQLPLLLLIVSTSNVGINLALIPRMGAMGAAIATVASEAIFCCMGMALMLRSPVRQTAIRIILLILPCTAIAIAPSLHLAAIPLTSILAILAVSSTILILQMQAIQRKIRNPL